MNTNSLYAAIFAALVLTACGGQHKPPTPASVGEQPHHRTSPQEQTPPEEFEPTTMVTCYACETGLIKGPVYMLGVKVPTRPNSKEVKAFSSGMLEVTVNGSIAKFDVPYFQHTHATWIVVTTTRETKQVCLAVTHGDHGITGVKQIGSAYDRRDNCETPP